MRAMYIRVRPVLSWIGLLGHGVLLWWVVRAPTRWAPWILSSPAVRFALLACVLAVASSTVYFLDTYARRQVPQHEGRRSARLFFWLAGRYLIVALVPAALIATGSRFGLWAGICAWVATLLFNYIGKYTSAPSLHGSWPTFMDIVRAPGRARGVQADVLDMLASEDEVAAPERTSRLLAAYYQGIPWARLNAGLIAVRLRREERTWDLARLHASLPTTRMGRVPPAALSLVTQELLFVPGMPADQVSLALARMRTLLRSYDAGKDFERRSGLPRERVQYELALALLRHGDAAEAEQLCGSMLLLNLDTSSRATMLATIALARCAQGKPYSEALAQAILADPDAPMVSEARDAARAAS